MKPKPTPPTTADIFHDAPSPLTTTTKQITVTDDEATGQTARDLRVGNGIGLRQLARRIGFSSSYVCDLEHGRRAWSDDLVKRYSDAIEGCVSGMKPVTKEGIEK